jgi:hypothetical protein
MHLVIKRLTRWLVRGVSLFLPEPKAQALERWRRGREEFRKLGLTGHVVVSYGKSGRTWLRVMLSRYYQLAYGLPDRLLLGFDNYHRKNSRVPRIFFTHDNYLRGYTGNRDSKRDFYDKKVVLLVRRPQDVAVSQYFQWQYRMRPRKKTMNRYPPHGAEVSLFDFVMDPDAGLPRIIEYLNLWASELPRINDLLVVRYEDMRAEPVKVFGGIVEFLGEQPVNPAHVEAAVEFASVDNLRQLERQKFFRRSGSRMTPRDRSNPHSYKVRRAKVGGYRDYFEPEQIAQIDALVSARLSPVFGYGEAASEPQTNQPASSAAGAASA